MAKPDKLLPVVMDSTALTWDCPQEGLDPDLLRALVAAASEHAAAGGQPLRITSGRRSLRRQAELMASLESRQLLALYGRQGLPDYIREILRRRDEPTAPLTPDDVYTILSSRAEGYISAHLFGAAVDLAPEPHDTAALRRILERHGFTVLDERQDAGLPCLHLTYRAVPRVMVRS